MSAITASELIAVLEFSMPVARTHVRMAAAVHHGYAVLTRHFTDLKVCAGLKVEAFQL